MGALLDREEEINWEHEGCEALEGRKELCKARKQLAHIRH